jgi:hypothetical protein
MSRTAAQRLASLAAALLVVALSVPSPSGAAERTVKQLGTAPSGSISVKGNTVMLLDSAGANVSYKCECLKQEGVFGVAAPGNCEVKSAGGNLKDCAKTDSNACTASCSWVTSTASNGGGGGMAITRGAIGPGVAGTPTGLMSR